MYYQDGNTSDRMSHQLNSEESYELHQSLLDLTFYIKQFKGYSGFTLPVTHLILSNLCIRESLKQFSGMYIVAKVLFIKLSL